MLRAFCETDWNTAHFRNPFSARIAHFAKPIPVLRTRKVQLHISRSGFTRSTFSKSDFNTAHFSSPIVHFAKRIHPFYIFQILIAKIAKRTSIARSRFVVRVASACAGWVERAIPTVYYNIYEHAAGWPHGSKGFGKPRQI